MLQAAPGESKDRESQLEFPSQLAAPSTGIEAPSGGAGVVFDGPSESDSSFIPPDPQIAAGPNHVVVAVNSLLAIYDKSGNLQGSFQTLSSFFSGLGLAGNIFDPRLIYDQNDQRFILSTGEIDFTGLSNGHVLLAVSATSDPTGVWNKFAIDFKGRNAANTADTFPDFPGLGLSQSAVYITTNQFELTTACLQTDTEQCFFSDAQIKVIGLPELLSGNPALNITSFSNVQTATGFTAFAIQPALSYGTPSAEFLVAADFSANPGIALNLFAISTTGTPTLSTVNLPVSPFSFPPFAFQSISGIGITTGDVRPLNAVWSNGSLWLGQNVAGGGFNEPVAQWYEIQLADLASARVSQSGTVEGSGDAYYPTISTQSGGTVGLVFSTSSEIQTASAAFTEREPSDPAGTMRSYSIYQAGLGLYNEKSGNRWGDYSGISADPDGNSLWTIAEFAGTPDPNFGTAVAQITAPPSLTVSPPVVDFKQVLQGRASAPLPLTITNISNGNVTLGKVSVTGSLAADFAISTDTCSNNPIAAGQTCSISITFTPSQTGPEAAPVSIPYGASNQIIGKVTGFGFLQALLSFSPPELIFPPTAQQSASLTLVSTLTNTGNTSSGFFSLEIGGDFTEVNNCGGTLAANSSCQFTVTFRPRTAGVQSGSISFTGASLSLSGTGVTTSAANLCPNSISFPDQVIHSPSAAQPVILTNNGSQNLTVTGVSASGDFAVTDDCLGTLPARTSCELDVTLTPSTTGTRTGSIKVFDDAVGSPQTVSLTGMGVSASASLAAIPTLVAATLQRGHDSVSSPGSELGGSLRGKQSQMEALAGRPLSFEPNQGQFDPGTAFVARGDGYNVAIIGDGMTIQSEGKPKVLADPRTRAGVSTKFRPRLIADGNPKIPDSVQVKMRLVGARSAAKPSGSDKLTATVNYLIGNDPSRWRTNIPIFAKVKTPDIYPGIDLIYYGNQRRLEYDFVVAPGNDPRVIRLEFSGQSRITVEKNSGNLVLATSAGEIQFHKPYIYQPGSDLQSHHAMRQRLHGRFVILASNLVGFQIESYDKKRPLVIDPVLTFSTYLAGTGGDRGSAIAVDTSGNAYVTGSTFSVDFPVTSGAFQKSCGAASAVCKPAYVGNAFITKFSPSGSLVYSTFLGGSVQSQGNAIAVNSAGNAYITGTTNAPDFPVTAGAFNTSCKPGSYFYCYVGFVTELNASGSGLIYSTYLGGSNGGNPPDQGLGIAVDAAGNAYVGGLTNSSDFPTTPGALQTSVVPSAPPADPITGHGFVTKLNPSGSALVYSTYLGGSTSEIVNGVALDSAGNLYATGQTYSLDFPVTTSAFQIGSYGRSQAFISKFSPSGSLVYSTLLGGSGNAGGSGVAVDSSGAAYVAGNSDSSVGFPLTTGALATSSGSGGAFVTKLHPAGCAVLYSTYLVSSGYAQVGASDIALDASGDAYILGNAFIPFSIPDPGFPLVNSLQPLLSGVQDEPYLMEIDPKASSILFSTYLGGSGQNVEGGIALDSAGNIYVTGSTNSQDFPVANAIQSVCSSCGAFSPGVFVSKLDPSRAVGVQLTRTSLTFASYPLGFSNPHVLAVGVMNNTANPLIISSVGVTGAGFSIASPSTFSPISCSGSIAPGAGCVVQVQFVPSVAGPASGTLTISDNGPGSPRMVALNGVELADFTLSALTTPGSLVKGTDSADFLILVGSPLGASPSGSINLSCAGASPAVCTFNPASITFGENIDETTLTVSNLSAASGDSLNFSVVGTQGAQTYSLPLVITFQDFNLGVASGSTTTATVAAGQKASYPLSFTGTQGFVGTVSLSCTGAPNLSTCTVSPVSLSLNGTTTVNTTVTVSTTARSFVPPVRRAPPLRWIPHLPLALTALGMLLALVVALARRRTAWVALAAMLMIVALWPNCGGGGGSGGGGSPPVPNGTPAGTYTLIVSGTFTSASTTLTHTLNLTLTVQ